jgi:ABC-type phosphate transport system substrate-binding protein
MGYLRKLRLGLVVAGTMAVGSSPLLGAGEPRYWVVVHPDNPAQTLSRREISRFFLKKSARWADGTPVVPIDLDVKVKAREAFSKDIHGRAPEAIKKYWQQMVFSGKAAPPAEVETEDDVLAHVRSDPAAIGYVSEEVVLRGVKILDVIDPPPPPSNQGASPAPRR